MKCYTQQLAFSAAVTTAIIYTLGALVVIAFPQQVLLMWAPLCYVTSLEYVAPYMGISFMGFLSGILQSFMYTYFYAWLLGSMYNSLMPQH